MNLTVYIYIYTYILSHYNILLYYIILYYIILYYTFFYLISYIDMTIHGCFQKFLSITKG